MAEELSASTRRQSEGRRPVQITNNHNHYYSTSAGDLTQVNAGLGNKTFAANKSYGDSLAHLGDVYGISDSAVDTLATSDQSSRLPAQSYPRLPTVNQQSLHEIRTELNSRPSPEPVRTFAEAKQLWQYWEHSSTEGSIAGFSEPGDAEEDNWATEVEQQNDEVDKEEDEENQDAEADDEDSDWLNMSSSKQSQTTTNDNVTVRHKRPPRHTSNNYYQDPGSVITIFDGEEGHLSCRTMVVMARSEEGSLECVSLCPHPNITQAHQKKYWTSHVPVCDATGVPTDTAPEFKKTIRIQFSLNTTLLPECFINCQHVWTIRNGVKYAEEGTVQNFNDLLEAFGDIQKKLYRDVRRQAGLDN